MVRAAEKLYVVGIGASAGGLEALLALLPKMRTTGCVTYIISQHMAHDAHSALMVQLLNRVSALPVTQAVPDEKLLPDRIYLLPPGKNGAVKDGKLQLQPPLAHMLSTPSADVLLSSIATYCKRHGIGLILSGTGSDGTAGCRAIKVHGGMTFAQAPKAAVYDGMPSSAIEAGVIDHVFNEVELPDEILARLPGIPVRDRSAGAPAAGPDAVETDAAFRQILQLVAQATGTDFSGYKEETLQRRLEKRQAALKIASTEDYLAHLQQHPRELANLQHAFLVSLSSFFRDHASFQLLQQELQCIVERKPTDASIRIWVPGCASGEEVYTLAIILSELLGERASAYGISITGTDLNPDAIANAVSGVYKPSAFKEMEPVLRERYFDPLGGYWKIKPGLQRLCQFECRDVMQHAPLQSLDLVSCRNLLIYLKQEAQARLLRKFHQLLLPQGLLFLGQSESPGISGKGLFTPIDSYYRIFKRQGP